MPQNTDDIRNLARSLEASQSRQHGREIIWRKTSFLVKTSPQNLKAISWSLLDRNYYRYGLPTYAYPLMTGKNEKNEDQIVVRGYNKIFNVEEIVPTTWLEIQRKTKGPYEVSGIEDGCTILIGGLWDGTLLVVSKFPCSTQDGSTGPEEAGERWLEKQLAKLDKSKKDLAIELRFRNVTLVAELCDDSFEERVMSYTGKKAGLYLHGINENVPKFVSYPSAQVQKFAKEWGFLTQNFVVFQGIKATRNYIENTSKAGTHNGRVVKGIVIRCKMLWGKLSEYEDFFFKCRLEGPYQFYHHWRECTYAAVHNRFIRYKKGISLTEEYLRFILVKLSKNPDMIKACQEGRGIIKLREDFLLGKNLKSYDIAKIAQTKLSCSQSNATKDIVLMSIGTLGCGKTTIAVSLCYLFQWGIVQNNDIRGKNRPPRFMKRILEQLKEKPVVFADRNNPERRERKQFLEDMSMTRPDVRVIALHYIHNGRSMKNIRRVTRARVISRGDNHQNIYAAKDKNKVISIMEDFIRRFQPLRIKEKPDSDFHAVINLDPTLDSIKNLRTVIKRLQALFPNIISKEPTSKDLEDAINYAIHEYKPNTEIPASTLRDEPVSYENKSVHLLD
ncbi:Bgt-50403 [Blumeria graminis f. sp. tritici]|uniref:Bgt-50403 n=1 Tax=Blumeria graminis f. sp. tritici TaxID=62690 RepID=A0A9X9QGN9_BLUGR|nr:Bgt-50403 [Blumeria graminis f. sp. tritici]